MVYFCLATSFFSEASDDIQAFISFTWLFFKVSAEFAVQLKTET